jgi:hypothetical protein
MADNKKSFLLYCDQIHLFEELTDEEAGRLVKHIFRYVNDQNPEPPDRITKLGFEPIKHQLKRDLVRYEDKVKKASEAGKASAEAKRLAKELLTKQQTLTDVDGRQQTSTDSTVIVTDTDKDTVTDILNTPQPVVAPVVVPSRKKIVTYPTIEEMRAYFVECNYPLEKLNQIFHHYADANWTKANGNKVVDWKRTIDNNWFADRVKPAKITTPSKAIPKQDYRPDLATDEEQSRYESYLHHGLKNLGPIEWGWIYEYQHRDGMKKHLIPDNLYMRAQDRIYTEKMAKEYAGED